MPHKKAVIASLDELTPEAARADAVNTIVVRDGRLIGDNTDGRGFVRFLRDDAAVDPRGVHAIVLGAGGAARAVALALADAGAARVVVAARRIEQAVSLAQPGGVLQAVGFDDGTLAREVAAASLVINATPLGSAGEDPPFDPAALGDHHAVVDLVYHPETTPLVRTARGRGAVGVNGLGMLVHQAALSFEAWTGVAAPIDAMRSAVS